MRVAALAVLVVTVAPAALSQASDDRDILATSLTLPPRADSTVAASVLLPRVPRPRWWAPLASAMVPGSGQAVLGQRRWLPYLAFEAWALIQYVDTRRQGARRRREYQSLARDVARARFPGPHPVGDFEYYEHMLQSLESGDFDVLPGGEIDPETDTTTYNGRRWLDARRLYWQDPHEAPPQGSELYARALEFYEINAIGTQYRWSWRSAQLEYDLFRRTIIRANVSYKRSVEYLGVLIANHALSAVDAFVTLRLRTRAGAPGYLEFEGALPIASILPRH